MNKILSLICSSLMVLSLAAQHEKPNFLFVFADDMSLDTIGAMQRYNCKTPNLDKLMASGASFNRAYNMGSWSGAVCVAQSRHAQLGPLC